MKKSFEELYEDMKSNESPVFAELFEKAKQEQKKANKIFWTIAIILDIIIEYFIYTRIGSFSAHYIIIFIIPVLIVDLFLYVIISFCFSKNRRNYKSAFKANVIHKLLDNFYDEIDYIPSKQMPREIYNLAKYNEYYNRYYSDDYMEGMLNNKYFLKMAEVHTIEEETHTDSDGHTYTTSTTKFHGLFAQINLNKSINSELLIRNNVGIFNKKRLKMDSAEFEKMFDVSASNQIIGMQLLTHDIMELLVSFKNMSKINYDISIYNDIMYLRFHTGSMFEFTSLKKGAYDEKALRKYYNVLDFTYTLSKMFIELIEKTEI